MISSNQFTLQELNREDSSAIIDLSALIGWDYSHADLNTIFSSGTVFGHKTNNGQLISTAAIFPYEGALASIGVVIVHPSYRGLKLGRLTTQACLDRCKGNPAMLVATAKGIPLYKSMGFFKVDTLYKLIATKYTCSKKTNDNKFNSRALTESVIDEVIRLDEEAIGANRSEFIRARIKQSREKLVLTDLNSHIISFGLSIEQPDMLLIGPIVAPDLYHAEYLIHTLINNYKGRIRIDIPSDKSTLVKHLQQCGFDIVNIPPVMVINTTKLPKRSGHLFAISSQAFG
jgi:GNAT superfamily N-acetyltransferase